VTVAGIQPKVSAARISVPLRGKSRRRDYILKLSPPELPRLVENEAFFMQLARSIRLDTAVVKLVHDRNGQAGLLVERFDRVQRATEEPSPLARIHQEDACQLLDRYPADKYRISLTEVAEALESCSAPIAERLRLLQLQALSYLIGNGDLHAKNISIQVVEGRVRLTPIYDLLSTLPYGDESLALKLEGRDKELRAKDFIAFGERVGVRAPATRRMLDSLVKRAGPHLEQLNEIELDARKTRHMERVIAKRLGQLGA
jgi:serine/threonine-protein kinase HipA